ncbi:hypothetical protein L6452_39232 [Arctium lappa]|uniref:Uncharacterized protein n=1 Tax=Arctium lappa TaxID=4217 RepID=A0ACB8XSX0_ARCLA|nr:hypothetical protein L6452_39232 [Arctium lappa]
MEEEDANVDQREGSKVNEKTVTSRKRPKHKVAAKDNEKDDTGSDASRLNIPQKPNVVTTPSGVRVILPYVRNDAHKSPSKANSEKSKKQVGISKSPTGNGSKSPMKKNSPMSHGKAKSPKRKDRTPIGGNDIYLTDPAPRAKCVKVAWRKQFPGKRLLYADITECKKLNVERRRPAISVWNMENLRRREYLELSDGGFGTWKLIAYDGIQKEKPLDVFAERSEIPKISAKSKLKIVEFTIEKAISDFPSDLDLRTLDMEFRNLFNQHDGYTSAHKDQNNDQQFHTPKKITLQGSKPNHNRSYGKKKEFNAYEIPKMDLGFSPDKHLDSPTPISSIPPMTGFFVTLNSKTKAICDAHMANKRESKLGDSLRSPYVKRTVAIDALETSSEKKICAWINAAIEPICTGVVALRGTIESLCARTEIYSNVIDSWAALLNHEERFRSKTSPRRLFMHSAILHNLMIQHIYNVGHSSYDSFAGLEPVRIAVKWCTQRINLRRSFVIADCEKFNALDVKERARLLQYADANREKRLVSI